MQTQHVYSQLALILLSVLTLILYFGHFAGHLETDHYQRRSTSRRLSLITKRSTSRNTPVVRPLIPSHTKYIHKAVDLDVLNGKMKGLVTKSMIFMGEIVLVENPLVLFHTTNTNINSDWLRDKLRIEVSSKRKSDLSFAKIWDHIGMVKRSERLVHIKPRQSDDKDTRNWFGVFQVLGGIEVGPNPNVAAIFGERHDDFACIVIATADIAKGSKLIIPDNRFPKPIETAEQFIDSVEIFKVLHRVRSTIPPDWTGHRFMQKAACLRTVNSSKWKKWCKGVIAKF